MKALPLQFIKSAALVSQLPPDQGHEVLLLGRSNVGKSSFINAISGRKKLAHCSQKPGCTTLFNCYQLASNADKRIMDVPGYGYAKRSKTAQLNWFDLLADYLNERTSLKLAIVIVDSRHEIKRSDVEVINKLIDLDVPALLLANKIDLLSQKQFAEQSKHYSQLAKLHDIQLVMVSTKTKKNLESVIGQINQHLAIKR